jgi:hypothetical protein
LLFAMALLVLLVGILDVVYLQYGMKPGFGRFGPPFARFLNSLQTIAEGRPSVAIQLGLSLIGASWTYTLSTAGLLLFGALVIDRLDRKLAHSD